MDSGATLDPGPAEDWGLCKGLGRAALRSGAPSQPGLREQEKPTWAPDSA